ncbi:hypothetical protein [Agromyces bracchium]|uniref:Uncharacterized protein n=1 Tax=Agromyces bracchium TaxID=88376 RepID=A0A6I3M413_9MICO|nr:hypothetical protein [Agromyces bracchium]MTH69300.1 hypothetical protein [Agromyces bracchium]
MSERPPVRSATDALLEASALWILGDSPPGFLVDAAVEATVAGLDSPALHELAGMSDADSPWDLREALGRALVELDASVPDPRDPATLQLALRELAAQFLHERISIRELVDRARSVIDEGAGTPHEAEALLAAGEALDAGRITAHQAQLDALDWAAGLTRA